MPGIDPSQTLLLKGIGKGFFNTVTNKFIEVISGQSLKLDVTATLEDVYAGDSLFPKYTYISKKEGSITITVADFALSQLGLSQSVVTTSTGVTKWNRVLLASTGTSLGTYTGVTNVTCVGADGVPLSVTSSGTAAASGVDVSATGVVAFGTGVTAQEYTFWFKSTATGAATSSAFLKNAMPEVAAFHWMLQTEDEDGAKYQIDIDAPRVRGDGKFSIDSARDKASVPSLAVKILDPGDGSDNFCTITVSKMA